MTIKEVYNKFGTPPNLQEHMMRVAGITIFLRDHWNNGDCKIDWNLALAVALLHDLGNVVKFEFDKFPQFLGDEQKNIDHWRDVQKKVIEIYGTDDHDVTKKMLEEIRMNPKSIKIILNKSFGNSIEAKNSNDWPLKILYYADLRVLPNGVGTMDDRIADVRNRMPKYTSRPDFEDLVSAAKEIEQQIQANINVPVSEISDTTASFDKELFLEIIV